MPYHDLQHDPCSIARPVSVLGDRWTLLILRQAFRGIRRFGQFQSTLGISRGDVEALFRHLQHGPDGCGG